jgi:DNA replication protein DnaC
MDEKLTQMLKYIRLSGLLANWDRYLSIAQKGNYSHARLLEYIVEQEYKLKKENAKKMRLARARIPEKYVIETFPFDRQPKLNKKKS